jgi:alanine racemase
MGTLLKYRAGQIIFDDEQKRKPYVWLEIDIAVLQENYKVFRDFVAPAVCSAVIKANAYGLGAASVSKALFEVGSRHFWVAYADEADTVASAIREVGGTPSYNLQNKNSYNLFLLNGPFIGDWCFDAYKNKYLPVINTLKNLEEWDTFAKSIKERLPAALHIDTGLHRLGMPQDEYEIFKTRKFDNVEWSLFMSHPAASSLAWHPANTIQLEKIADIRSDFPDIPFSFADTAAVLRGREYHFDMVRVGIGLFGIRDKFRSLKSCLRVYGTVLQIQEVPAGSGIGYDWDVITDSPKKIATVSCGYSDGIFQLKTNSIMKFSINGQNVPTLGKISMDLTVVDVTGVDVQVGDTAVILDDVGSASSFVASGGISFHKLLTGLGTRVRRFFR